MEWRKPSPELTRTLEEALLGVPCRSRPMFGCPAFFAGDHMFAGVYGDDLFVRASGETLAALRARYPDARAFEPIPGRRMKEYLVLPGDAVEDRVALVRILGDAFLQAAARPPKPPKAPKAESPG